MEHSEAKLFTEDDLNDDLSKKYVKCKCVNILCIHFLYEFLRKWSKVIKNEYFTL